MRKISVFMTYPFVAIYTLNVPLQAVWLSWWFKLLFFIPEKFLPGMVRL